MDKTNDSSPELTDELSLYDNVLPLHDTVSPDELFKDIEIRFAYTIGRFNFVLDKSLVCEIVIFPVIYSIPNSPRWLYGVMNLRGNIIPVFDLADTIGTSYKSTPGHYVLVIDKGSESLALLIDNLPTSLNDPVPTEAITNTSNIGQEFLQPGVQAEDTDWVELDIKSLVKHLHADEQTVTNKITLSK